MEVKLEEFAAQVVKSWENTINPPSLEDYYKNTLDIMLDKMTHAECYLRVSTALDEALLKRQEKIEKVAEKLLDRWIADVTLTGIDMPDPVSKKILRALSSLSEKMKPEVQARIMAVRRMKKGGMTDEEIASVNSITVTAVRALFKKSEDQVASLKRQLEVYEKSN